jgi:hypothetical protein
MKTVEKFSTLVEVLGFRESFVVQLPEESEILTIQTSQKDNVPYLYALVDTSRKLVRREFLLRGTGSEIAVKDKDLRYIGTYQYQKGDFEGHVFEVLDYEDCQEQVEVASQDLNLSPLMKLLKEEQDLTRMFDSDQRVAMALLDYIRSNREELARSEKRSMCDFALKCKDVMAADYYAISSWWDRDYNHQ